MAELFLEIWFEGSSLREAGITSRDIVEDPINDTLESAGIGLVSGGGAGERGVNIDVEIEDEAHFDEALALIRQVLRGLNVPQNTIITRYEPVEVVYRVYDE